jgi:hypothetical protein
MTERPGLTDRQRAAAHTAAEVFDSVAEPSAVPFPLDGDGGPRAGVAAAVSLFSDVVQRIVDGYADLAERAGPAASNGWAGAVGEPITLHGRPGETAVASVWIHNMGSRPVPRIVLRLTRLTAADGTELAAGSAAFEPAELTVGAAASAHAVLTLPIPTGTAPGSYHGHVLGGGEIEAALPVRLVVLL